MAEKEYIEREAAIERFTFKAIDRFEMEPTISASNVRAAIAAIPAADVRPVVLCRDCKYAPIGDRDGDDLEWPHNEYDGNPCPHKCSDNWYSHKPAPDWFCADGVKREEN